MMSKAGGRHWLVSRLVSHERTVLLQWMLRLVLELWLVLPMQHSRTVLGRVRSLVLRLRQRLELQSRLILLHRLLRIMTNSRLGRRSRGLILHCSGVREILTLRE
jgi:hypothetical protein